MLHDVDIWEIGCRMIHAAPNLMRGIVVIGVLTLLGGCATTTEQNDPAQGGFWRAVQGVSGGQYEERQRRQEAELDQQQEVSRRLDERYAEIRRDQEHLDEQIRKYQMKVKDVKRRVANSIAFLSSLEGDNRAVIQALEETEGQLADLRVQTSTEYALELQDIERIMKEIEEMESLVSQLTAGYEIPET